MAEEARRADLGALVDQLNAALVEVTPYRLAVVPPAEISPIDKNAHYMTKRTYDALVANIKRDKNLSSLPFCWKRPDGTLVALSGNHRLQAARDAGVPLVMTLYTDAELSRAEQRAIQISHNALVGQDNPGTLRELWNEIDDLALKVYTGLDDKLLETMNDVKVTRINEEGLRFEELTILFLSPEIERIKEVVGKLGNANKARLAARFDEFDRFFTMLLDFKEAAGIVNTGTALLALVEIGEAWISEHNDGERNESQNPPS